MTDKVATTREVLRKSTKGNTKMAFNSLKSFFGWTKPLPPARVPTDEVLPMFDFDARPQVRNIIIGWTLRFDDILDADRLGVALCQLLEIGDWRKLGGRLRRRVSWNGQRISDAEQRSHDPSPLLSLGRFQVITRALKTHVWHILG